jgi:DNA invertase Pin-like site-specific DNA recombinase
MKTYAYLRVVEKGHLDCDGLTRQLLAIHAYAMAHGLDIAATFREQGVSGEAPGEERPAWSEMLAKCGRGSCILIEKLDRLAGNLMVQEMLLLTLRRSGIPIISTCEPDLGAADPTRAVMRQALDAFAQQEKAQFVTKVRAARERKKTATGRCEGQKPYGNRPGEADTIAWMRDRYNQKGGSYRQVAIELNARGITGRHGGTWTPQLVSRILQRGEEAGRATLRRLTATFVTGISFHPPSRRH